MKSSRLEPYEWVIVVLVIVGTLLFKLYLDAKARDRSESGDRFRLKMLGFSVASLRWLIALGAIKIVFDLFRSK